MQFPVRWDGEDLLGADNRILVWGKQGEDDRDDVDRAIGKWAAETLNALWQQQQETQWRALPAPPESKKRTETTTETKL